MNCGSLIVSSVSLQAEGSSYFTKCITSDQGMVTHHHTVAHVSSLTDGLTAASKVKVVASRINTCRAATVHAVLQTLCAPEHALLEKQSALTTFTRHTGMAQLSHNISNIPTNRHSAISSRWLTKALRDLCRILGIWEPKGLQGTPPNTSQ